MDIKKKMETLLFQGANGGHWLLLLLQIMGLALFWAHRMECKCNYRCIQSAGPSKIVLSQQKQSNGRGASGMSENLQDSQAAESTISREIRDISNNSSPTTASENGSKSVQQENEDSCNLNIELERLRKRLDSKDGLILSFKHGLEALEETLELAVLIQKEQAQIVEELQENYAARLFEAKAQRLAHEMRLKSLREQHDKDIQKLKSDNTVKVAELRAQVSEKAEVIREHSRLKYEITFIKHFDLHLIRKTKRARIVALNLENELKQVRAESTKAATDLETVKRQVTNLISGLRKRGSAAGVEDTSAGPVDESDLVQTLARIMESIMEECEQACQNRDTKIGAQNALIQNQRIELANLRVLIEKQTTVIESQRKLIENQRAQQEALQAERKRCLAVCIPEKVSTIVIIESAPQVPATQARGAATDTQPSMELVTSNQNIQSTDRRAPEAPPTEHDGGVAKSAYPTHVGTGPRIAECLPGKASETRKRKAVNWALEPEVAKGKFETKVDSQPASVAGNARHQQHVPKKYPPTSPESPHHKTNPTEDGTARLTKQKTLIDSTHSSVQHPAKRGHLQTKYKPRAKLPDWLIKERDELAREASQKRLAESDGTVRSEDETQGKAESRSRQQRFPPPKSSNGDGDGEDL